MCMKCTTPKGIQLRYLALVTAFAGSSGQNKHIDKKEVQLRLLFLGVSLVPGSRAAGCTAGLQGQGLASSYVLQGCKISIFAPAPQFLMETHSSCVWGRNKGLGVRRNYVKYFILA